MKIPTIKAFDAMSIIFPVAAFLMSRVLLMLYAQQTSANLPLSEALYHADVFWYHSLAENGYDSEPKAQMFIYAANWAFFPLYPMAVRFLANVSDMQIPITGIVLSNTAFAFTLVLLYRYTLQLTDKPTAQIITALMAISPFSLYYSLMYTEGLYTVLMIAIMLSAKNNRWITAGILGALLSATRVLGVMIVFPLLAIAVNQHGFKQLLKVRTGTEPALFAIMIVPLGLFAYMLFLYDFTGDALAFMHIQWAWARELHNPLVYLFGGFINDRGWINYNALLALSGITGGIYLWRKQLEPEALILLIGTFIPLSTGLASLQRYVGTLFPFMILIGLLIRNRPLLTGATFLLFAFLFLFYVWSWTHGHWYMI